MRQRQTTPRAVLFLLVLLPALAFYGGFFARYGTSYLLRRDENVALLIVAELGRGHALREIPALSISPGFIMLLHSLEHLVAPMVLGRVLCTLSALACVVLSARLAVRLFGPSRTLPLLTAALVVSSPLFIAEGTRIQLSVMSLAFALLGLSLLPIAGEPLRWPSLLAAGVVFGIALQVKALSLLVAPLACCLILAAVWQHRRRGQGMRSLRSGDLLALLAYAVGWAIPLVAMQFLLGSGGEPLAAQLGAQGAAAVRSPLDQRIAFTLAVLADVFQQHLLLALCGIAGLAYGFHKRWPQNIRRAMTYIGIWVGTVMAILLLNFPTWDHHYVYLIPPLALSGAWLLDTLAEALARRMGKALPALLLRVGVCLLGASLGSFLAANVVAHEQLPEGLAAAAAQIARRTAPTERVWSDEPAVPLLAERPTEPLLVEVSLKRLLAGGLRQSDLFALWRERPPRVVVAYDGLFTVFADFTRCVEGASEWEQIGVPSQQVYWIHNSKTCQVGR